MASAGPAFTEFLLGLCDVDHDDEDRPYHSIQATLDKDTGDESRRLLDLSVNAEWTETVPN